MTTYYHTHEKFKPNQCTPTTPKIKMGHTEITFEWLSLTFFDQKACFVPFFFYSITSPLSALCYLKTTFLLASKSKEFFSCILLWILLGTTIGLIYGEMWAFFGSLSSSMGGISTVPDFAATFKFWVGLHNHRLWLSGIHSLATAGRVARSPFWYDCPIPQGNHLYHLRRA